MTKEYVLPPTTVEEIDLSVMSYGLFKEFINQ